MNRRLREARQALAALRAPHFDVTLETAQAVAQAVAPDEPEEEDDDCPVCMQPPVEPRATSCGHTFCRRCLWVHVVAYGRQTCPMCRAAVSPSLLADGPQTGPAAPAPTLLLRVGNLHAPISPTESGGIRNRHSWSCYVRPSWPSADARLPDASALLTSVHFYLHPTFRPPSVVVTETDSSGAFRVQRRGWGTFEVNIEVLFRHALQQGVLDRTFTHDLEFGRRDTAQTYALQVDPAVLELVSRQQPRAQRLSNARATIVARASGAEREV